MGSGFSSEPDYLYKPPPSVPVSSGDVVLIAEGRRMPFNRDLLCRYSPVLAKMLADNAKKSGVPPHDILLPDKKAADIQELLSCLNVNPQKQVDDSNFAMIMPLAVEFQIASLLERGRSHMQHTVDGTGDVAVIFSVLSDAFTYKFRSVAAACLRRAVRLPYPELRLLRGKLPHEVYAELLDKQILFIRASVRASETSKAGESVIFVCRSCARPSPVEPSEIAASFAGSKMCTCRKLDADFSKVLESAMP